MRISEVGLEQLDLKYERLSARRPGAEKRLLASLSESGQQSPVIVVAGGEAGPRSKSLRGFESHPLRRLKRVARTHSLRPSRRRGRQAQCKNGSPAFFRFDLDLAAHRAHSGSAEGQAESEPAVPSVD